jgi:hypothetical protein
MNHYETTPWVPEYKYPTTDGSTWSLYIDPDFASLAPRPSKDDFLDLKKSIQDDGLQNKLRVFVRKGKSGKPEHFVYDGWSRARAMFELGWTAKQAHDALDAENIADGSDPARIRRLVYAQNHARRHLNMRQKMEWVRAELITNPQKSDKQIADTVGVGAATVRKLRKEQSTARGAVWTDRVSSVGARIIHPVRAATLRKRAAEEFQKTPTATGVAIAAKIGISPVLANRVKARVVAGERVDDIGALKPRPANFSKGAMTREEYAPKETFEQGRFDRAMLHLGEYTDQDNLKNAKVLLAATKEWVSTCTRYINEGDAFNKTRAKITKELV